MPHVQAGQSLSPIAMERLLESSNRTTPDAIFEDGTMNIRIPDFYISGYLSLANVYWQPERLNALIGANGSCPGEGTLR